MARSVVDVDKIKELNIAINGLVNSSDAILIALMQKVSILLEQFDVKLSELTRIKNHAATALAQCEIKKSQDEHLSCTLEEQIYREACERCRRCEMLIMQAKIAIEKFENSKEYYKLVNKDLASRATAGLERVNNLINKYGTDQGLITDGLYQNDIYTSYISGDCSREELIRSVSLDDSIHIVNDVQIAGVVSTLQGGAAVVVDMDKLSHKLDDLPAIKERNIDTKEIREAAQWILSSLALCGIAVASKEMLLQQKTDDLFSYKYGISRTELLLASGPKQKEYIAEYNRIYSDLKQELVNIKKEELMAEINDIKEFLALEIRRRKEGKEITLSSIELVHTKLIELQNKKNQLASLIDGGRPIVIPDGKTKIGGLSEDGLIFMLSRMDPIRFITVSNILASSGASFCGEYANRAYVFSCENSEIIFVSYDGHNIERHIGHFADADIGISGSVLGADAETLQLSGPSLGLTGSLISSMNCEKLHYLVNDDGSAVAFSSNSHLGIEGEVEVGVDFPSVQLGAGVSVAKYGKAISYIESPELKEGIYRQIEYKLSGTFNAGVALSCGYKDGALKLNVPFAELGVAIQSFKLSDSEYPLSVKKQLTHVREQLR